MNNVSKQFGAQDPNQVKRASQGIEELLLNAVSRNANNPQRGGGLYGAIKKDNGGGILGDLMNVLGGRKQVSNQSTMNGEGIINHLLGNRQLEVAQMVTKVSGLTTLSEVYKPIFLQINIKMICVILIIKLFRIYNCSAYTFQFIFN